MKVANIHAPPKDQTTIGCTHAKMATRQAYLASLNFTKKFKATYGIEESTVHLLNESAVVLIQPSFENILLYFTLLALAA